MDKVLDKKFIMYSNLFEKITRVMTGHCFNYNETIIFVVPRHLVSKAIGPECKNLKKLGEILKKRIRIVAQPSGIQDIENFVSIIVSPVKFRDIKIDGEEATINAGMSKGMLIGRGKKRLDEMSDILEQYFGIKKVKIA